MKNSQRVPKEELEQQWLFQWAVLNNGRYPELKLMYAVPNGGYKLSITTAQRMKRTGTKAGVPDICLPVPRKGYHGLYIEMKRQKGGVVSADQKEWIKALNEQGYLAIVAHGFDEAQKALIDYIRG